jgi:hypothetical protein
MEQLSTANTLFALDLFLALNENNPTGNIFISPFSISSAMAMVFLGTKGNSAAQLSKVSGSKTGLLLTANVKPHQNVAPLSSSCELLVKLHFEQLNTVHKEARLSANPKNRLSFTSLLSTVYVPALSVLLRTWWISPAAFSVAWCSLCRSEPLPALLEIPHLTLSQQF